jgi:hypothetical protein
MQLAQEQVDRQAVHAIDPQHVAAAMQQHATRCWTVLGEHAQPAQILACVTACRLPVTRPPSRRALGRQPPAGVGA